MAKKRRATRTAKQAQKGTNWLLLGGSIAAVIVVGGLFYLLFLSLQDQDTPQITQALSEYCRENPDNCVTKGSDEAPVNIVEVSDYGCGHCRNFNLDTAPLLENLYVRQGQVQWVSLPYALGAATTPAAEAAMCANEQDAYFEFHEKLFEKQSELQDLTSDGFRPVAQEVGLDMDAFNSCVGGDRYADVIQANISAATRAGVRETPNFYINDTQYRGNIPLTTFQQAINSILSASQ